MERLIPFIMAGDPSLEALPDILRAAAKAGIATIEVGVPHSDPIADGPVLQAAAQRAIEQGVTLEGVLECLAAVHESPDIVLFSYLNPVLQMGTSGLIERLRTTRVRSLLIVDLPFGEEPEFESTLRDAGFPVVPLVSPTTSVERAARIFAERPDPGDAVATAQRFVYVVARLGITGEGTQDFDPIAQRVKELQSISGRPLAVGFGLSEPAALERVRAMGAIPVVGTALVQKLTKASGYEAIFREFVDPQ